MEVVEEPPSVHNSVIDDVKVNTVQGSESSAVELDNIGPKSNGVNECIADQFSMEVVDTDLLEKAMGVITDAGIQNVSANSLEVNNTRPNTLIEASAIEIIQGNIDITDSVSSNKQQNVEPEAPTEVASVAPAELECVAIPKDDITDDQVTFQTEIYVEKNGEEIAETVILEEQVVHEDGHILTHISENIELNEALQLSDLNVENNNSSANQEVFNKEELLDILEGNNVGESKQLESHLALQQLSRLQSVRGRRGRGGISNVRKTPKSTTNSAKKSDDSNMEKEIVEPKKRGRKRKVIKPLELSTNEVENADDKVGDTKSEDKQNTDDSEEKISNVNSEKKPSSANSDKKPSSANSEQNASNANPKQKECIVNDLVQDWEDEPLEESDSNVIVEQTQNTLQDTDQLVQAHETVIAQENSLADKSIDPATLDTEILTKSEDESTPQRRQGRVIKKKVIFDPDNPDTFTKGKISKKDVQLESEQTPSKKVKTDVNTLRSKSPTAKMQWKKPCPKNSKQNKRTTEIDRLLMDEGAVNMIYQLTPEAPKGGKNTRTKAEFIKKIQSSKPDSKEMKFRERKKEVIKTEENEPKKVASGKRSSVSSSVKSAAFEDFENHSADDSIIYRRHSSSSYSSTCMSPRRLSDVEAGCIQSTPKVQKTDATDIDNSQEEAGTAENSTEDIFMADSIDTPDEIINKDACLSIKQKLNSKLALALNKRKRESTKSEKPAKQKRIKKVPVEPSAKSDNVAGFEYLSISFDQRMAEICIKKTGSKYDVETVKELERALLYVDTKKDISVTFLTSECGSLCSNLDLTSILNNSMERRTNAAYEIAESIRCLLCSVNCHSKLLCTAVFGLCSGISLPLLVLSDIAMASEHATFTLTEESENPPVMPGVAVLSQPQCLSQTMLNNLVILGRQFSSSEAVQGGLINRTLWPEKVIEQGRAIAKSIASQPPQNILLKKQMLTLHKRGEAERIFLSALEAERDLVVEYWTSVSGQEMLRAAVNTA